MPYRSKQLLHYFFRTRNGSPAASDVKTYEVLTTVVKNPVSLRNTMLIASLHYVWTTRDVDTYNATVLFHRAETIQSLNEQLKSPRDLNVLTLVKHISTLCFTDLALGNMINASAHLDGLVAILDHFYPIDDDPKSQMGMEEEVTSRYLLLQAHIVLSLNTWMQQSQGLSQLAGQATTAELSEYATSLFDWHSQDIGDLQRQLDVISMYPFFFLTPPRTARFQHVDATPIFRCLRALTKSAINMSRPVQSPNKTNEPTWAWIQIVISQLQHALTESHVASLYGSVKSANNNDQIPKSSWFSIAAAAGLYIHSVLGLWDSGNPIKPQLYRYIMSALLRDLTKPKNYLHKATLTDLWFWKHFTCYFSLKWHQKRAYNAKLQPTERFFRFAVRSWSQTSGIIKWQDAQERLQKFVWPNETTHTLLARNIWENAIQPDPENS